MNQKKNLYKHKENNLNMKNKLKFYNKNYQFYKKEIKKSYKITLN